MYVFRIAEDLDPMAFMAIMQSKCFLFLYQLSNQGEGRVIPQVKASKLQSLPFPNLNGQPALQTQLAEDCRSLIDAKERMEAANTEKQRDYYANRCVDLERRIDTVTYQFYELTTAEVEMIESVEP